MGHLKCLPRWHTSIGQQGTSISGFVCIFSTHGTLCWCCIGQFTEDEQSLILDSTTLIRASKLINILLRLELLKVCTAQPDSMASASSNAVYFLAALKGRIQDPTVEVSYQLWLFGRTHLWIRAKCILLWCCKAFYCWQKVLPYLALWYQLRQSVWSYRAREPAFLPTSKGRFLREQPH